MAQLRRPTRHASVLAGQGERPEAAAVRLCLRPARLVVRGGRAAGGGGDGGAVRRRLGHEGGPAASAAGGARGEVRAGGSGGRYAADVGGVLADRGGRLGERIRLGCRRTAPAV